MSKNFTSEWRNYRNIIKEIEELQGQLELFPNRKSTKVKIKELRRKLFKDYEGFLNTNNTVNEFALRSSIRNWFKAKNPILSSPEVSNWLDKQDFKTNNIVRYIVDENIGKSLHDLLVRKGIPPHEIDSILTDLAHEVVKVSERYTHIPNTDSNFHMFMNGSTQYLDKEITAQEENASPIEEIMYEALKPVARRMGYRLEREYPVYDEGRLEIRYSLDIVFVDDGTNKPLLDVETDGLTFHSGYQQMADDRARDRWLLIRGIPTMRFTSREVFNDLDNCVIQVESALQALYNKRQGSKSKRNNRKRRR